MSHDPFLQNLSPTDLKAFNSIEQFVQSALNGQSIEEKVWDTASLAARAGCDYLGY